MAKSKRLTVLFGFGLVALACVPARGGTFYTSATAVSTSGCGNMTDNGSYSAGVSVSTPPAPISCGNGDTVWGGANVTSIGALSTVAEVNGNGTSPFSFTTTATLDDTLAFYCIGTCPGGTLTGNLEADITGAVFSQLDLGGIVYDSYTATITDTVTSAVATSTGELCPTLAQSASCTSAETNPSSGYTVSAPFTIVPGDPYTLQIVMTSFAQNSSTSLQVLATQNDPLSLTLPTGISYESASGEFLAPEPSSWLLVGGGLVMWLCLARRKP